MLSPLSRRLVRVASMPVGTRTVGRAVWLPRPSAVWRYPIRLGTSEHPAAEHDQPPATLRAALAR